MITIICLLMVIIVASILAFFLGVFKRDRWSSESKAYYGIVRIVISVNIAFFIMWIQPWAATIIPVGHVGLKIQKMGSQRGISKTTFVSGFVGYNTWTTDIKEYPITQQHIEYDSTQIITRGGFTVTIKPSFNWSVNYINAPDMYQSLRQDVDEIKGTWLKNAIIGAVNDVANLYTVDSIFNHRASFESEIVREANVRVKKWFTISQLRTGITPPKEITDAINAKTRSVQEAQEALQNKIKAEAQAQVLIAKAKGDSADQVIRAAGRAESMRKEQLYLTPLYVDFIRAQKYKGDVPTTLVGSGGSVSMFLPNK